jgi:hypothetical protein
MSPEVEQTELPEPTRQVPEFYVDATALYASVYDLLIVCGLRQTSATPPTVVPQVRIRMSLQHAWIVAKILNRVMREQIAKQGPIGLPRDLLTELKLVDEYREDMGGNGEPGPADE